MSLLELHGLGKTFNAAVLKGIDLTLAPGEVLALMGANGAGKSTLCNIISGQLAASTGSMRLQGLDYQPGGVAEAERLGVRMVRQELSQINQLSVAENIGLAHLPKRWGFVDYPRLNQQASQALAMVGLESLDPTTPMHRLGVGQQQLVEIAKTISQPCKILLLDEPTAALTDPQIDILFQQIRRLQKQAVAILYISHRLADIERIADTVTILRDGNIVSRQAKADISAEQIVKDMSGVASDQAQHFAPRPPGDALLTLTKVSRPPLLNNINLTIRRGEILGIGGLIGAGRTELLRAIFGADLAPAGSQGEMTITRAQKAQAYAPASPAQAVAAGIGMIAEDRKQQAALLPLAIKHNITLAKLSTVSGKGWINSTKEAATAGHWQQALAIKCDHIDQPIGELSGGNQQKAIIARWLLRDCDLLMFDEPTRGIDVHTKRMIYQLLDDLARAGKAIVVVSSESEELTHLCDRIAVMSAGEITRVFNRGQWSEEQLMAAACENFLIPGRRPQASVGPSL
ncbi:sugar ABC transporter ATP-binding protein [Halioxenophilus aromaticivorans]|uniref:Sugar ABC transporter ATP-binding protein n=1 Tax=Halioxenophilus aromaticivorans TaxID=1306992 RepID=A0AAV3U2R4_9ALTE